jgi:hypothetical protein
MSSSSQQEFNTIKDYNEYLISNDIKINIKDYIKWVAINIHKIDISFMNHLLELMTKDEINIHHRELITFEVCKASNGSADIKRLIDQFSEFKEDIDFRLCNVAESAPQGGCTHKIEYYFTPFAFGLILMRSKNQPKYAYYYNLCQKCIYYHSEYESKLKDSKIDILINRLDKSNKELEESNQELKISNQETRQLRQSIDNLTFQYERVADELSEIKEILKISSHDRAPKLENLNLNYIIL